MRHQACAAHLMGSKSICSMFHFFSAMLIICLAVGLLGGCSWVGRTTGKVQAKIERKSDALEGGYQEGYEQEKNKSAQKPVSE